jgi:hypothetical protein
MHLKTTFLSTYIGYRVSLILIPNKGVEFMTQ